MHSAFKRCLSQNCRKTVSVDPLEERASSESRFPNSLKTLKAGSRGWNRWKQGFYAQGRCAMGSRRHHVESGRQKRLRASDLNPRSRAGLSADCEPLDCSSSSDFRMHRCTRQFRYRQRCAPADATLSPPDHSPRRPILREARNQLIRSYAGTAPSACAMTRPIARVTYKVELNGIRRSSSRLAPDRPGQGLLAQNYAGERHGRDTS